MTLRNFIVDNDRILNNYILILYRYMDKEMVRSMKVL
jgi:hypothetical protein